MGIKWILKPTRWLNFFIGKPIYKVKTFGSIAGAVVQVTAFSWIMKRFGKQNVISVCLLFAGLNSAFTSLGNIAGPIVAGFLFDIDINYPYTIACMILLVCFVLSLRDKKRNLRDTSAAS